MLIGTQNMEWASPGGYAETLGRLDGVGAT
jgi:hypothetical protein